MLFLALVAAPASAQDASWIGNGTATGDWNNGGNWTGGVQPFGVATFGTSTTTAVTLSSFSTSIDTIVFDSGAPSYTVTATTILNVTGAGIVNNSGAAQTFTVDNGFLQIINSASTSDAVINSRGGIISFYGTSTAATASIANGIPSTGRGGILDFHDSSTAGTATIITDDIASTRFLDNSDGGLARFITHDSGGVDFGSGAGLLGDGRISAGSIEGEGYFDLGDNQLTVGGNNLSTEVSGIVGDSGFGGSLVKIGTGTLTLTGDNRFSGGLTIAQGTVSLGHDNAAGTGTITTTGSVIGYLTGVTIANTIVISSDTTQFQVLTGATATQSGLILEDVADRPLEKIGGGTLIVDAAGNSGSTLISAGTWRAGQSLAFSVNSAHTVAAGATLDLNGFDQSIDALFGAGTVTNSGASDAVLSIAQFGPGLTPSLFSGVIQDGATNTLFLQVDGPGLTLTGANTYTGGTLICDCSTLQLGNGGNTGSIVGDVTSNGKLIFNRGNAYDFAGDIIQGFGMPGVVEQKGPGVLTLSGNNSYAGGTVISGGTLRINDDVRLGDTSGGVTFTNGAALRFSANVSLDANRTITLGAGGGLIDTNNRQSEVLGTITGSGGLTVNGGGDLRLAGTNDFTGGITVYDQTFLVIDSDAALGAASNGVTMDDGGIRFENDMTIGAGRTLTLTGGQNVMDMDGNNVEIAARITGVGQLVVTNGCGCVPGLTLTAANDYSGGTLVENGSTLTVTADNNLGAASGGVTLDSGELAFGADATLNAARTITLSGFGGIFETNGFTAAIQGDITGIGELVLFNPGTLVLGGNIGNDGNIQIAGGDLVLTGTDNHTGDTLINTGSLQIGNGGTTGTLASGGIVFVDGALIFNRSNSLTFDNEILDCGCGAIVEQKGSGTTILTAVNLYGGATLITAGTLQINNADAVGTSIVTLNGGALQAGANNLTLVNDVAINTAGGAVSVTGSDSFTISSVIADGNGSGVLTKSGSGTLILTNAGTYTGGTIVSAGTLQLNDGGSLGSGTVVTNATLAFNHSTVTTIASAISGTGGITQLGSAALQFSAAQSYAGITAINAGTFINLTGNGAVSNSVNIAANGTFDISAITPTGTTIKALTGSGFVPLGAKTLTITDGTGVFSGVISGTGAMVFAGGITTLTGNNTYSGGTAVNGTLSLGSSGAAGTGPITTTGSVIDYAGGVVINNPIQLGSNTTQLQVQAGLTATQVGVISETGGSRPIEKIGAGTLIISSPSTYSGATTITAGTWRAGAANVLVSGSAFTVAAGGTLDLNNFANTVASLSGAGNVSLGSAALTTGGNNAGTTFSGVISGSGSLTKTGSGMMILSGANTYTGATIVTAGGVQVGAGGASGSLAGNVSLAGGTSLAFNRSNNLVFAGAISGAGVVRHLGTGVTSLTGASTYTGATEILAGTLAVNGSITSAVSVAGGGKLSGVGTVGSAALASGGTLAPGNSIGTLNVSGNVSFAAGSIYQVEVNAARQSDRLIAGSASLNGTVQALPEAGNYALETTYRIIDASGGVSGAFASVTSSVANLTPTLIYGATSVDLRLRRNDIKFGTVYGATANQIDAGDAVFAGGVSSPLFGAMLALANDPAVARRAMAELSGEIHASLRAAAMEDGRIIRNMVRGEAAKDASGARLWASLFGGTGEIAGDANAAGVHHNDAGVIGGVDFPVMPGLRAGVAGAYTEQKISVAERTSSARGNRGHVIGYAGWKDANVSLSAGVDYGWGSNQITRALPSFSESARAGRESQMTQLFGDVAVPLIYGDAKVEPYANLAWVSVTSGAFSETSGITALAGRETSDAHAYATLGARLGLDGVTIGEARLVPRLDLGWQHAFGRFTPAQAVAFAATGQGFTVRGAPLFEDAAVIQADLAAELAEGLELAIGYDGAASSRGYSHAGKLSLRWLH